MPCIIFYSSIDKFRVMNRRTQTSNATRHRHAPLRSPPLSYRQRPILLVPVPAIEFACLQNRHLQPNRFDLCCRSISSVHPAKRRGAYRHHLAHIISPRRCRAKEHGTDVGRPIHVGGFSEAAPNVSILKRSFSNSKLRPREHLHLPFRHMVEIHARPSIKWIGIKWNVRFCRSGTGGGTPNCTSWRGPTNRSGHTSAPAVDAHGGQSRGPALVE